MASNSEKASFSPKCRKMPIPVRFHLSARIGMPFVIAISFTGNARLIKAPTNLSYHKITHWSILRLTKFW